MSRLIREGTDLIYRAAELFVEKCLRTDDSLFTPGRTVWNLPNVADLYVRLVENPDWSANTFIDKFKRQLEGTEPIVYQLAAELMYVHLLIPRNIGGPAKRKLIDNVLSWSSIPISVPPELERTLDYGIAAGGIPFKMGRPHQVWFLLEFMKSWKGLTPKDRTDALADPWRFKEIAFSVDAHSGYAQREALLYLVFPDDFEPMVSRRHKEMIVESFAELAGNPQEDIDKKLATIRASLEKRYGKNFTYYSPEVRPLWDSGKPNPSKARFDEPEEEIEVVEEETTSQAEAESLPLELLGTNAQSLPPEETDDLISGYVPESDDSPLNLSARERRLITQPYDLNVQTIVEQISQKELIVRPAYQRGYIWDDVRASRLIESLILNIPIPPCYFAEEEDGKNSVIDGQQRLFSLWRFVTNQFKLKGLAALTELNALSFNELPERDQRTIKSRTIRCIVITRDSNPEIRFEVFYRLNTGSVQLTDQEIRNAIYRGDFNEVIKELAEEDSWLRVLNKKSPDKRMRDDELVLRFFAVQERYLEYQSPLRSFLNSYMASKTRHDRKISDDEKEELEELFKTTIGKVLSVFDGHAFRIFNERTWERQVNRALFDAVMLVFSRLPANELSNHKGEIEDITKSLFNDRNFFTAISRSTADRGAFYTRIRLFSEALAKIGLDSGIHQELRSL